LSYFIVFKNRYILAATTVTIIALQIMLWLLVLKAPSLPNEVVLWYTLPSTQQLAPASYLWIVPAIALASWLINLLAAWRLFRRFPATSQLLVTVSAGVSILAAIGVVKTVFIYVSS
jgi:hypothetical protein